MTPLASPFVVALLFSVIPASCFSRKGLRSPAGVMSYVGHACLAGAPGALYLWAVPGRDASFEVAAALAVVGAIAVGAMLLQNVRIVQRPSSQPSEAVPAAPGPAGAYLTGLSPWLAARMVVPATQDTPVIRGSTTRDGH